MDIKLLSTVLGLHCLALISPGADFLLTLKNTLAFGRNRGVETAVGFGLGIAFHVSYSSVGMAILLQQHALLLTMAKMLGSAYLFYLGIRSLWSTPVEQDPIAGRLECPPPPQFSCLKQGFLTNALNPKATLFILGLFTSVIPAEASAQEIFLVGLGMVILTVAWFATLALFLGHRRVRSGYLRLSAPLNRLFGIAFVAAALWMLRETF